MKKINKLLSMGLLCSTLLGMSSISQASEVRTESTASAKGFTTSGLTYLGDTETFSYKVYTDKYTYGYCSMWSSVYKIVVGESDNTSCYIIAFIESSIDSTGNSAEKRYFRNKQLTIETQFECSAEISMVKSYPDSSSSTTSNTVGFEVNGTITSNSVGVAGGFSYSNTTQYSTVTLTKHQSSTNNVYTNQFIYDFKEYKSGDMTAPNIGLVEERMYVIYQIKNYTGNETFNLTFKTHASIFKDAKWPLSNATRAGEIIDKFDGKSYYGHSESNIAES